MPPASVETSPATARPRRTRTRAACRKGGRRRVLPGRRAPKRSSRRWRTPWRSCPAYPGRTSDCEAEADSLLPWPAAADERRSAAPRGIAHPTRPHGQEQSRGHDKIERPPPTLGLAVDCGHTAAQGITQNAAHGNGHIEPGEHPATDRHGEVVRDDGGGHLPVGSLPERRRSTV